MIAGGVLLPGETHSGGKGGLGSMNKDQLERWIKENGITGAGADKIRNKWKNLGPNLPLANIWGHETPSDTFNRQNYPGRDASDDLRIDHMRKYHNMKKKELA